MHNKDAPASNSWHATKIDLIKKYKFTCAFENSNTKDYITEKLFGPFAAGSVPVHMGVKNVHSFSPSPKSALSVHDFDSAKDLVAFMKALMANDTAYSEYMEWKHKGVSREFRALVDMARVHSTCRICIRIGDLYRWENGWADDVFDPQNPYVEENKRARDTASSSSTMIRARERGKFWFKALYLPKLTFKDLCLQLEDRFDGWLELWDIYNVKKRMEDTLIHFMDNESVQTLTAGQEIEIIFFDRLEGSPSKRKAT